MRKHSKKPRPAWKWGIKRRDGAEAGGWHLIDMKKDWSRVFALGHLRSSTDQAKIVCYQVGSSLVIDQRPAGF